MDGELAFLFIVSFGSYFATTAAVHFAVHFATTASERFATTASERFVTYLHSEMNLIWMENWLFSS